MAAKPAPGAEYFTAPRHPNQRRYEALRAYFTGGLSVAEAEAIAADDPGLIWLEVPEADYYGEQKNMEPGR